MMIRRLLPNRRVDRFGRRRRDEFGVEAISMIIVMPFLLVMVLGLIDVGFMVATRLRVTGIVNDAARAASFDGGDFNPRLNTSGIPRSTQYQRALTGPTGQCIPSRCLPGTSPVLVCTPVLAVRAGDPVTCTVDYAYKPLNGGLLNGPLGLGIGSLLKPFKVQVTTRAETGQLG